MGFFIYLAQTAIYALLMWGIYCVVWRNRPALSGSRMYLLASAVLPAVLPAIRVRMSGLPAAAYAGITLPEIRVGYETVQHTTTPLPQILLIAYCAVSGLFAAVGGVVYFRLVRRLGAGLVRNAGRYQLITGVGIGPGTLGKRIFFPGAEVDDLILRHERAHIDLGHRFDLLLSRALRAACWASPAHWLIGRELRLIHEFEADRQAIRGRDVSQYAALLLAHTIGAPGFSAGHAFAFHPLKRRLLMMQRVSTFSGRWGRGCLALILTTAFAAYAVCIQASCKRPGKESPASGTGDVVTVNSAVSVIGRRVSDDSFGNGTVRFVSREIAALKAAERSTGVKNPAVKFLQSQHFTTAGNQQTFRKSRLPVPGVVYTSAGQMPVFKGDLNAFMSSSLHYPDKARKAGVQGRSVVHFVVGIDGLVKNVGLIRSSGNAELDAEALRVVGIMPAWTPGVTDGKQVSVFYTLPITFTLSD